MKWKNLRRLKLSSLSSDRGKLIWNLYLSKKKIAKMFFHSSIDM